MNRHPLLFFVANKISTMEVRREELPRVLLRKVRSHEGPKVGEIGTGLCLCAPLVLGLRRSCFPATAAPVCYDRPPASHRDSLLSCYSQRTTKFSAPNPTSRHHVPTQIWSFTMFRFAYLLPRRSLKPVYLRKIPEFAQFLKSHAQNPSG